MSCQDSKFYFSTKKTDIINQGDDRMEQKLIEKMIRNCFMQYEYGRGDVLLSDEDLIALCQRVIEEKQHCPEADVHEVVQDVVYEFLTT
jgi:hypothetical protein